MCTGLPAESTKQLKLITKKSAQEQSINISHKCVTQKILPQDSILTAKTHEKVSRYISTDDKLLHTVCFNSKPELLE